MFVDVSVFTPFVRCLCAVPSGPLRRAKHSSFGETGNGYVRHCPAGYAIEKNGVNRDEQERQADDGMDPLDGNKKKDSHTHAQLLPSNGQEIK